MSRPKAPLGTADDIEQQFYDALQHGQVDRAMAVWSDDDDIVCVHPDGTRHVGPQAVRAGFEALLSAGRLQVTPLRVRRLETHSCAVHSVVERVVERPIERAIERPDAPLQDQPDQPLDAQLKAQLQDQIRDQIREQQPAAAEAAAPGAKAASLVSTHATAPVLASGPAPAAVVAPVGARLPEANAASLCFMATNVYLRTAIGWRLVAHHASPATPVELLESGDAPSVLH